LLNRKSWYFSALLLLFLMFELGLEGEDVFNPAGGVNSSEDRKDRVVFHQVELHHQPP
jgi:hypothetical protein